MKEAKKTVVVLVDIPPYVDINRPGVGDYDHPMVRKVIPCWKQGDQYLDLRSMLPVEKKENYLEWPVLTGTVFEYKDKTRFLLTKCYQSGQLKTIPLNYKKDFHPETMMLHQVAT